MLLTITTTQPGATDLGYLLHKNPSRVQTFELSYGLAHVFYPEATPERCTAALVIEVDPVGLVRGRRGTGGDGFALEQYVNDRPYSATSFMSVAIAQVYGSALGGRCKEKPELVDQPLPLEAKMPAVPCRGGEAMLRNLFEPLGYKLAVRQHPLDEKFPHWGPSRHFAVTLSHTLPLKDLLSHLYVLIPVLDNDKHYWVGDEEVEKLLRFGERWLADHPARELIASRYLKHQAHLSRAAITRIAESDEPDPDAEQETKDREEESVEKPVRLNEQRMGAVVAALRSCGARRVLDMGCGPGKLVGALLSDKTFTDIVGVDVSWHALERAKDQLRLDRLPPMQRQRVKLLQGSLTYRDDRLQGFDAAALVEVIEHLDPPRLSAMERVLFEHARPATVIVTTPNSEYNVRFPGLPAGAMRHRDHRFEWTRAQFQAWAAGVADRFGYRARFLGVGEDDAEVGTPTQMAIFSR